MFQKNSISSIQGELKEVFKDTKIHYGLYFSQYEWFNPMYNDDLKYNTTVYPEVSWKFKILLKIDQFKKDKNVNVD